MVGLGRIAQLRTFVMLHLVGPWEPVLICRIPTPVTVIHNGLENVVKRMPVKIIHAFTDIVMHL